MSAREYHGASTEVYGFVSWICTFVLFLMYLIWAFVPDEILHHWGITYYPNKYWAIAAPTWLSVTFFAVIFLYVCLNLLLGSADLDSLDAITDSHAIHNEHFNDLHSVLQNQSTPQICDIPLQVVNQVIYG